MTEIERLTEENAKLRAIVELARQVVYCVEINDPDHNTIQLRGYRKPVVVSGWTAMQFHRLISAIVALPLEAPNA